MTDISSSGAAIIALGAIVGGVLHSQLRRLVCVQLARPVHPAAVILACALGFAFVHDDTPTLIVGGALVVLAVAAMAIDWSVKLIPDRITFPGTLLGLVLAGCLPGPIVSRRGPAGLVALYFGQPTPSGLAIAISVLGAAGGFLVVWSVRHVGTLAIGIEPLGLGDAKLAMMLGAFLGPWPLALSVPPALAIGIVLGVVYLWRFGSPPPFGPALALGGVFAFVAPDLLARSYRRFLAGVAGLPGWANLVIELLAIAAIVALLLRARRRAARYSEQLDDEYARLEPRG